MGDGKGRGVRRFWICVLAVVSLVAHASALVRHNGAMVQQALAGPQRTSGAGLSDPMLDALRIAWEQAGLQFDDGSICHTPARDGGPAQPGGQSACPICAGLAGLFVAPAGQSVFERLVQERPAWLGHDVALPERQTRFLRPSARGPPPIA